MSAARSSSLPRQHLLEEWRVAETFFELEQGGRLVLAATNEGVVDLDFMLSLDSQSASAWRDLVALERKGGQTAQGGSHHPLHQAWDLALEQRLIVHQLLVSKNGARTSPPRPQAVGSTPRDSAIAKAPRPDFIAMIRKAFAEGLKVRFRARGRSMRPFIPGGSQLECMACSLSDLRPGMVALYTLPDYPLVAHRVAKVSKDGFVAKGDSAGRTDHVDQDGLLGLVVERVVIGGSRRALSSGWRRAAGRWSGRFYRLARSIFGCLIVRPFRGSMKRRSLLRRFLAWGLKVCSGLSRRMEDLSFRWRHRFDVWRAATLSSEEKDLEREKLYARKSVVEFTAREENVEAGLTLIEEVLLNRLKLSPSRCLVLGCGPGRESVALAQQGHTVVGLERDPSMLVHAHALAERHDVAIDFVEGNCVEFKLDQSFDVVVIFSGLINMVMPRSERVRMLELCREHLVPGGRVLLTFLSDYELPGQSRGPRQGGLLRSMNPDHQPGDRYLLNECVHLYPAVQGLLDEVRDAGLTAEIVHRDQRAYHRKRGQVRGFAVLRNPE